MRSCALEYHETPEMPLSFDLDGTLVRCPSGLESAVHVLMRRRTLVGFAVYGTAEVLHPGVELQCGP